MDFFGFFAQINNSYGAFQARPNYDKYKLQQEMISKHYRTREPSAPSAEESPKDPVGRLNGKPTWDCDFNISIALVNI